MKCLSRALSFAIAAITCASPSAATLWSPPANIHPGTAGDDWYPRLAITPDGYAWVVWMGIDPVERDQEAYYSRWNGVAWDPPKTINPPNQYADRFPIISCASDGALWAVWQYPDFANPGKYIGLTSRWNGAGWTSPDTVWIFSDRHDNVQIAAVNGEEAWFIREGAGDIIVYHHIGSRKDPAYRFEQPGIAEYQPTITIDHDGVPWAVWESSQPLVPNGSYLQYTRFVNGRWEPPQFIDEPPAAYLAWIATDQANHKWIICQASNDPANGLLQPAIWVLRWEGTRWSVPQRISDAVQSPDSFATYLSVSRSGTENPRAVWVRGGLLNYTRYDVVTSAWDGSTWSTPELVGALADSAYKNWPDIAVRGSSIWAAWMEEPKAAPYVFNIVSIHSLNSPPGPNRVPVAKAGGPYAGAPGVPLEFNGSASSDPDGDSINFEWRFGDGDTGAGATPLHLYAAAGDYNVTLRVTDPAGLFGEDTTTASVQGLFAANVFYPFNLDYIFPQILPTWVWIEPINGSFAINDVVLSSVSMMYNGLTILTERENAAGGDRNHNGVPEIRVCFARNDLKTLFASLPNGTSNVTVALEGDLTSGGKFQGTTLVHVIKLGFLRAGSMASISPNPLNPQAKLTFVTTQPSVASAQVFDLNGRLVRTLMAQRSLSPGIHEVTVDGRNDQGNRLASGIYYYRVRSVDGVSKGTFVVLK